MKDKDTAWEALAELEDGGDFATLARKHSTCSTGTERGGSLGTFGKGEMVPEFDEVAFNGTYKVVSNPPMPSLLMPTCINACRPCMLPPRGTCRALFRCFSDDTGCADWHCSRPYQNRVRLPFDPDSQACRGRRCATGLTYYLLARSPS